MKSVLLLTREGDLSTFTVTKVTDINVICKIRAAR